MVTELALTFEGYWHIGDGRSDGAGVDALVRKTPAGLPVVPGRQLKGRLRALMEQAARLGHVGVDEEGVTRWFGTPLPPPPLVGEQTKAVEALEPFRFETREGELFIGDCVLGSAKDAAAWEGWAADEPASRAELFHAVSSTAIDQGGSALKGSLRCIELTIPLTLHARIEGPADAIEALRRALPLLREVGGHATRGLGRVSARLGAS